MNNQPTDEDGILNFGYVSKIVRSIISNFPQQIPNNQEDIDDITQEAIFYHYQRGYKSKEYIRTSIIDTIRSIYGRSRSDKIDRKCSRSKGFHGKWRYHTINFTEFSEEENSFPDKTESNFSNIDINEIIMKLMNCVNSNNSKLFLAWIMKSKNRVKISDFGKVVGIKSGSVEFIRSQIRNNSSVIKILQESGLISMSYMASPRS